MNEILDKSVSEKVYKELDEDLLQGFQAPRNKMLKHYELRNQICCVNFILDPKHKIETFDPTLGI